MCACAKFSEDAEHRAAEMTASVYFLVKLILYLNSNFFFLFVVSKLTGSCETKPTKTLALLVFTEKCITPLLQGKRSHAF